MDIVCPALALIVEAESNRITLDALLSIILTTVGECFSEEEEVVVVVTGVTEDCEIVLMYCGCRGDG